MSLFASKYADRIFSEADLEDVVIDLDGDKAPDLDVVEDNVLNSHDDEVAEAIEGLPGDPVEESYALMAESERYWNAVLMEMGMNEMNQLAKGNEVLYEAVDIKGFFAKAKEFFVNLLKKVANIVKRYLSNVGSFLATDKKFLEKYGSQIDAGAKAYKSTIYGYIFTGLEKAIDFGVMRDPTSGLQKLDLSTLSGDEISGEAMQEYFDKTRATMAGEKGKTVSAADYQESLFKYFRNGASDTVTVKPTAAELKAVLSKNTLVKDMKKNYSNYQKSVNEVLKNLRKLENDYSHIKDDTRSRALNVASHYISRTKGVAAICHTAYSAFLKAARDEHRQARSIANKYVRAANKDKYPVKNESGGFFDSLNLI